jgi:hypothetical protein
VTDVLERPQRATPTVDDRSGSLVVAGALASLWTLVVGLTAVLVVVLVVWASDSRSGSSAVQTVRMALDAWLVANHVPLTVPGGRIALAPLGLMLGPLLLLARGGRVLAREHGAAALADVVRVATAVAAPYSVLTALVTAGATISEVRPSPVLSLVWGFAVGFGGAALGAWRAAGLGARPLRRLPDEALAVLSGAAGAAGALLVAGGLLVAVALVGHADASAQALDALRAGGVGAGALLLLQVGLVPNAAIWGVAYIAGPGFAVGSGAGVGPYSVTALRLPGLPMLAAVPGSPAPGVLVAVVVLVLVATGVVAGWLTVRRLPGASVRALAAWGFAAGVAAGLVIGILAALSGGQVGPAALSAVGPSPWKVGLVLAGELAPVSAAFAALTGARRVRP